VWLIGRSYSVALERRKEKADINDDFYTHVVVPAFRNSKLDFHLDDLLGHRELTAGVFLKVLETHQYLTRELNKITKLDKRAFSSKYLHFHLPALFFIYDSRAVGALRQFVSHVPEEFRFLTRLDSVDKEYARFACKSLSLKQAIRDRYGISLTTRQLDNLLIKVANEKLSRGR
jgi:hypothetical protein